LTGLAEPLKRELKVPICVTLQGDDLFLDQLGDSYKKESLDLIRRWSDHVDAYVAVSQYYLDFMPAYLGIPRQKMRLARLGINLDGYTPRSSRPDVRFTIGYFARIAPEKGLHVLVEAYVRLRQRSGAAGMRLVSAGYLPPEHQEYLDAARERLRSAGLDNEFEYRGEVDRDAKVAFLQELDVLSVPTTYHEPKGMFVFEAMASGVPVVQPRHGAFPEIVERTGGGILVEPDDPQALADGLDRLRTNSPLRESLSKAGAAGVRLHYSVQRMAEQVEAVYREVA